MIGDLEGRDQGLGVGIRDWRRDLRYFGGFTVVILVAASAAGADGSLAEQMLAAHNAERAKVKTRPLVWSDKLAKNAQEWANTLAARHVLVHQKKSKYGENLFEMDGAKATPEEVVKRWASEVVDYDYKTNKCRTGQCGHYTQVIWRDTKELGCAVSRMGSRVVWVCEYNPPGNYVGERPY